MRIFALFLAFGVPLSTLAQQAAAADSSSNRAQKPWGLGLGLGSFLAPVSGTGVQGFYGLLSDLLVEGQVWAGTWDAKQLLNDTSGTTLDKFDVNAQQAQLRLKFFAGNSFYLALGVGVRSIEFDLAASDTTGTQISGNLKSRVNIANLAIGNTWTFDSGFYIGGEWLALAVPLGGSQFSSDFTMSGPYTSDLSELEADARKSAEQLGKITSVGALTLHLGFQF